MEVAHSMRWLLLILLVVVGCSSPTGPLRVAYRCDTDDRGYLVCVRVLINDE